MLKEWYKGECAGEASEAEDMGQKGIHGGEVKKEEMVGNARDNLRVSVQS